MVRYFFHAIDAQGRSRQGFLHAANKKNVLSVLENRSFMVLSVRRSWAHGYSPYSQKRATQRLVFFVYLEQLSRAGLHLLLGIRALEGEMEGYFRYVLRDLGDKLEEGTLFSQAVRAHPDFCDPVALALLQLGEKTGEMTRALTYVTAYFRKKQEVRDHLLKAIRYPLFVLLLMSLTFGVLLQTLLPALLDFVEDAGVESNCATQSLVWVVTFLQNHETSFLLGGLLLGSVFLLGLWQSKTVRFFLERAFISVPLLGTLRLRMAWAHFFWAWGLLLESGISAVEAFQNAECLVRLTPLKAFLEKSRKLLLEGTGVAFVFSQAQGITSPVYQLLLVGEKSGRLTQVLSQIVDLYEKEIERERAKLLTLLQPVCLGILGLLILWVVSGTLLPLYDQLSLMPGLPS